MGEGPKSLLLPVGGVRHLKIRSWVHMCYNPETAGLQGSQAGQVIKNALGAPKKAAG